MAFTTSSELLLRAESRTSVFTWGKIFFRTAVGFRLLMSDTRSLGFWMSDSRSVELGDFGLAVCFERWWSSPGDALSFTGPLSASGERIVGVWGPNKARFMNPANTLLLLCCFSAMVKYKWCQECYNTALSLTLHLKWKVCHYPQLVPNLYQSLCSDEHK